MVRRPDKTTLVALLFMSGVMGVVIPLADRSGLDAFSFWGIVVGTLVFATGCVSIVMMVRQRRQQDSPATLKPNTHDAK